MGLVRILEDIGNGMLYGFAIIILSIVGVAGVFEIWIRIGNVIGFCFSFRFMFGNI